MSRQPSRFSTPVTIEIHTPSNYEYKPFSDIQMAYIWVKSVARANLTFEEACNSLDEAYRIRGLRGKVFIGENRDTSYYAYYGVLTI